MAPDRNNPLVPRIVLDGAPLLDPPTAVRPWREEDIPAIVAACQDPAISRWTRVPSPYGEADARAFMLRRLDSLEAGAEAGFAIVSAGNDTLLLGSIALMRFAWPHARGEIGYWLAPEARGAGHATRAVRLVAAWGFAKLGLERIELYAATGNPASQAVAERAGFTREAVARSYQPRPDGSGGRDDMVVFSLLVTDGA
jgi:RimJ/RimL family protein N-acetyltransferase